MTDYWREAVRRLPDSEQGRVEHATTHMNRNKAYRYAVERSGGDPDGRILDDHASRFRAYRSAWRGQPDAAIRSRHHHDAFSAAGYPPLCLDIESAAVCDLACPFCFRQTIATPDRLMRDDLFRRIADQAAELGVPSVKLNWRGEPLLHPKLPELIDYAKRAGILETIINTNATRLTEEKSRALIDAGLDLLIYSFDGGTKATYEAMRPGRGFENEFEPIIENIRRFARIRDSLGSVLPRTKIQMILTDETHGEQEDYFKLFTGIVDDVSVKVLLDRDPAPPPLSPDAKARLDLFRSDHALPESAPYWTDSDGAIFVASGRLPCEQPFQRMMIGYDGRVSMCCYDWGNEYPIGYLDEDAYRDGDKAFEAVLAKAGEGAKSYELLSRVKMPARYTDPPHRVQALGEIWHGELVNEVRRLHIAGQIDDVAICRNCAFKETYRWLRVGDHAGRETEAPVTDTISEI